MPDANTGGTGGNVTSTGTNSGALTTSTTTNGPMTWTSPMHSTGTGQQTGQNGNTGSTGSTGSTGQRNAVDGQGNDLGYPANTPIAEMTDRQAAAYWKTAARKHEGLWKSVAGDGSLADVQDRLKVADEFARSQQTPAEQQLATARDEGRKAGIAEASASAARAILTASLTSAGISDDDAADIAQHTNVAGFVNDGGQVDTAKVLVYARRFTPAATATTPSQRVRDFGAGTRGDQAARAGDAGREALKRRHGVTAS